MQTEEQLIANETVEETSTPTVTTSKDYPMDMNPIVVSINLNPNLENPVYAIHKLRKPSFMEESERERLTPLETRDAGKVDGKDASSMSIDDETANVKIYDKIISSVSGYAIDSSGKPEDEVSPDKVVDYKGKPTTVRELIPSSHKSTVIRGMFPSDFEVDDNGEDFVFSLVGGRDTTIKQEIGGKVKLEDGTNSEPDYTVFYTFREPTEAERKTYRTKAVNAVMLRDPKTSTTIERRSTNLSITRDLFDAMIQDVRGATVKGKEIRVSDKEHLEAIPASFKKGAVIRLFNSLETELKN